MRQIRVVLLDSYIRSITRTLQGAGDEGAIEMSYYGHLQSLIQRELNRDDSGVKNWRIEINMGVENTYPDFSIYDDEDRTVARIEAKKPNESLEQILRVYQSQLKKYLDTEKSGHPNLIITNFLSFRKVKLENEQVVFDGESTTLFENQDNLLNFETSVDAIQTKKSQFNEKIVKRFFLSSVDTKNKKETIINNKNSFFLKK